MVAAKEEARGESGSLNEIDFLGIFSGPRAPLTMAVRNTRRKRVSRRGPEKAEKMQTATATTESTDTRDLGRRTEPHDLVRVGQWGNSLVTLQELRQDETGQRRDDDLTAPPRPGA